MSLERVLGFFESKGMAERVLILDESSATVELAAHALHCPPERIAKTLSFLVRKPRDCDKDNLPGQSGG